MTANRKDIAGVEWEKLDEYFTEAYQHCVKKSTSAASLAKTKKIAEELMKTCLKASKVSASLQDDGEKEIEE